MSKNMGTSSSGPPTGHHRRTRRRIAAVALLTVAAPVVITQTSAAGGVTPVITVLSNRADLVSGGNALVEVNVQSHSDSGRVRMSLNGEDVTDAFARQPGNRYVGLVTGLRDGKNELIARGARGNSQRGAKLTITNHSAQGPIFSGPQVQPWICGTEHFGLGAATGPGCDAPTRFEFFYKSTDPTKTALQPYDPANPAPDVAKTTTDKGLTVPYVVRRERGVINRGIYDIAVLFDPRESSSSVSAQQAWNGKLYWPMGGGCGPDHEQRGLGIMDVLNVPNGQARDLTLGKGFAVGASTLTTLGNNCNDVVGAETVMMVKEHMAETYGPVRFTVGLGGSGGSMLSYLIAANYPGLFDGIIPFASFPDMWTIDGYFVDCHILAEYFARTSPHLWQDADQKRAVHGMGGPACETMAQLGMTDEADGPSQTQGASPIRWWDPTEACTGSPGEPDWAYDPLTNPAGVRCTVQDFQARVFGYRASDGFANRPFDSVGLQYGLHALIDGKITPQQFVDLNAKVGGRDIDYRRTTQRMQADLAGLRNAYRSGRVVHGSHLTDLPIIDMPLALNDGLHVSIYSQVTRARIIAANRRADNHAIWKLAVSEARREGIQVEVWAAALSTMDEWLSAIEVDTSHASMNVKVVRNKPVQARDSCWVAGKQTEACDLPDYADPRLVAGRPLTNDIFKCQLKALNWRDYGGVTFTASQKETLRAAFPTGVCDWDNPGVQQQKPQGSWLTYSQVVGGERLGPPPHSVPVKR
ncbi:hypothetical protein E1218_02470 [Kribbella turkmenica]|uniref:DUF6351 domain-containing protein n=1 Tax=Kribbella turkmenica TaxID=2530375 RepID=A0A4R4XGE2_9ACTN|nr:DUF6351 family protein [Kribbella turkmenica]TDD30008.1 hypothetical protein E1218_02470 [Kribbella turkmenica]